jgi:hypothetical protein
VQIAMFGGTADLFATRGTRSFLNPRCQRAEDRFEARDDGFIPSDHQAVASLRSPDPAAGPGVHIVNALRFQLGRAANVIVIVGVSAIDQHIIRIE